MKSAVRTRFWVEAGLALLSALLAALTAIAPDWIEELTGWEPDAHSGSFEWTIVVGLVCLSAMLAVVARSELRRSGPVAATTG